MRKGNIAIISATAIILASCIHEFPYTQDETEYNDVVVVEGYITNEYKKHTLNLTRLSSLYNTTQTPIMGAFVAVTSGDSTYFYQETKDGIYESKTEFSGVAGNVYFMHIQLKDSVFLSAESTMLPVTPPDKLTFSHNSDGSLSVAHIAEPFVAINPAKYVLTLHWLDDNNNEKNAMLYYYSLTTIDISQLFEPPLLAISFPEGTQVIEKKYSIDQSYENYLRSLLAETRWAGGYFDQAHGNLHTNIVSNKQEVKTAGYFSANTVYIDTVLAKY
jgi:hypothetical protein